MANFHILPWETVLDREIWVQLVADSVAAFLGK